MSQVTFSGSYPLVNMTNNSATLVIPNQNASGIILPGHYFYVQGENTGRYDVATVSYSSPNTTVTLTAPYSGTTGNGKTGVFHKDFTSGIGLPLAYDGDLEFAQINRRQMQLIDAWMTQPFLTTALQLNNGSNIALRIGADNTGTSVTDSVQKNARVAFPHYLNAEEPASGLMFTGTSSSNQLAIGGGTALMNAATAVEIYTAANNTTVSGTLRFQVNSAGRTRIGASLATDDGANALQVNGGVVCKGGNGIGYGTGAGGTVTQLTSRTTGVTLNKPTGEIILVSAAGSATYQSFTVTNSVVAATDVVRVCQKTGTDLYEIHVTAVAAGSFRVTFRTTGGATTEAPVFQFAVIKSVIA